MFSNLLVILMPHCGNHLVFESDVHVCVVGTLYAACELMKKQQADILGCMVVIELKELNGIDKLKPHQVFSLLQYWGALQTDLGSGQALYWSEHGCTKKVNMLSASNKVCTKRWVLPVSPSANRKALHLQLMFFVISITYCLAIPVST